MEESLSCVNGGAGANNNENPNSEVPYKGNYYTSWGLSATAVTSAAKKPYRSLSQDGLTTRFVDFSNV